VFVPENEAATAAMCFLSKGHDVEYAYSIGVPGHEPTVIYEDNPGCIALTENPVMHKRTKHIDIRHHFIRERVESGEIVLKYVATRDQLADMLTKPLKRPELERLRSVVMGYSKM
jgi:hypothetical protein